MKKNRIDLHTHSTGSDGTFTPTELLAEAYRRGLHAIALTDHDTIEGIAEASEAFTALKKEHPDCRMEFVPGIEISVSWLDHEIHMTGLHLNRQSENFEHFSQTLTMLQDRRSHRNERMIERMQAAGIDINMEKLLADQGDGVLTRANFARYLLNHGYINSIAEAFDKYLGEGKPFYIPREYLTPAQAIDLIHSVDGLATLAHPLLYNFTDDILETVVRDFKNMGLDAMEAYYSMNKGSDTIRMKALAARHDLILSGGSDFHGSNKPHIQLGSGRGNLYIPEEVLTKQKEYLNLI